MKTMVRTVEAEKPGIRTVSTGQRGSLRRFLVFFCRGGGRQKAGGCFDRVITQPG